MSQTLFASVLRLNRQDCHALRITDPYSLHRVVYSLFPDIRSELDKQTSETSGIQFADLGGDFHGRDVLLLSNREPMEKVDGQYGEIRTQPLPNHFLSHHRYRFKLIVNPTRRNNSTKKLVPIRQRDEIAAWFVKRAQANWGFIVEQTQLQIDRVEVLRFQDKSQRNVTLAQAHLQGTLQVISPDLFAASFARGIGRGRAFGCGLLQIVPLINPSSNA